MDNEVKIYDYLSIRLRNIFMKIDNRPEIREIRLRAYKPLIILTKNGERFISEDGKYTSSEDAYSVSVNDIKESMEYICNYSLYAYEDEVKNGYITITGGNRVGICGKAVIENGKIKTIRNISFINIRIAHEIKGCSDKIMKFLYNKTSIYHTLIVSAPGRGKTTLLRDIVRNLSDGFDGHSGLNVGIADERGEIAACHMGIPQMDIGIRTDVLDGSPKSQGMMLLIRSMAPKVIAVDEIGSQLDIESIRYAINCGCKIIATIHALDYEELLNKPYVKDLIEDKIFERIIILSGGENPGTISGIFKGRENIYDMDN